MCNVCPAKYWLCVERAQRVSCRKFFYEFLGERLCVLLEKVIHAAALDASLIPLPCKSKLAFNFCSRRKKLDLVIDLITCDSFIFDTLHRLLIWYPMLTRLQAHALDRVNWDSSTSHSRWAVSHCGNPGTCWLRVALSQSLRERF